MFLEWSTDERASGAWYWDGHRCVWSIAEGPDGVLWDTGSEVPTGVPWDEFGRRRTEELASSLGDRGCLLRDGEPLDPELEDDSVQRPVESDHLDF